MKPHLHFLLFALVAIVSASSILWGGFFAKKYAFDRLLAGNMRGSSAATEELVTKLTAQLASSKEGSHPPLLASGWDEAALALYNTEKEALVKAATSDPNSTKEHTILPLQPVRTMNQWFQSQNWNGQGPGWWEYSTFVNFFTHLSGVCRYYVGFGTWIGPTMFFAAQLVDETYGIEADPVAFAKVETNLALNSHNAWAKRVHLNHIAVGLGSNETLSPMRLDMASAQAGNSCSGVGKAVSCGIASTFWKVNSYPLPALLKHWGVPTTRELFIKVDVEMFECQLVPSWLPWIESLPSKPVFHIAFHSEIQACSEEEYRDVYNFARHFDTVSEGCMDHEAKNWTCGIGEHLFLNHY